MNYILFVWITFDYTQAFFDLLTLRCGLIVDFINYYRRFYLDRIYFCPHHPDKGFKGEITELKVTCSCRKPEIGLIQKAVQDFNLDLSSSWFIGDTTIDVACAKNARIKSILVETGHKGEDKKYDVHPDFKFPSLIEAVNLILSEVIS